MNTPSSILLRTAMVLCIDAILSPGMVHAEFSDENSRLLFERILAAHQAQSEALANYEYRAEWTEHGEGAETLGTIHRIQQGERGWFQFDSTHNACGPRIKNARYRMETRGVVNEDFFATWSIEKDTGQYLTPKWFERGRDGRLPDSSRVFDYALTRIRPVEQAMGPGGQTLAALVDSFPSEKIVITCQEFTTNDGEARVRVTIDLPDHGIPGAWASLTVNPAKGFLVEASVVMGRDGAERTRSITLREVAEGVWFPQLITLETTGTSPTTRFRANEFRLLEFKIGGLYPEEQFTLRGLEVPPSLLSDCGVSRYYLDGRWDVTTIDGKEHLGRVKRASFSGE